MLPAQLQKQLSINLPDLYSNTITKENIFIKQTHFKFFYKEIHCIEYIDNLKTLKSHSNLYLFGEDTDADLSKRFFGLDYETIYLLSTKKKFHLYEYYGKDDKLKLYLDIDIKPHNIPKDANKKELFDNVLSQSINLVSTHLKNYNVDNLEIIILSACGENKLSAHMIFNNVVFNNVYEMKYFMSNVKSYLIDNDIIDMNVYKKGCFRMLWNSKYGTNRNFEFYKAINYEYENDKQLFMDCLLRNVTKCQLVNVKMPTNVKLIKKRKPKRVNKVFTEYSNVNVPISQLQKYVDILDITRADKYNQWLEIGMVLHNCNPTNKCFELWDKWSQQSQHYDSKDINAYKWNSFQFGYYSIGTLKHYAKMDNPEKYSDTEYSLEKPLFDTLKFSSNYLLKLKTENIKDNESFVSRHIIDWMNGHNKMFAVKSTYDTGKTTLISKIIKEFNVKKVLFVSYRQTLTNDLYGNFKDLGVNSYLDKIYDSDKIICQIESLHRLLPTLQFIDDSDTVPVYDLVILDEIESILNHFRSSTISNKEYTFNLFRDVVFNAEKVLALDGDFHNRSYQFLKYFGEPIILENEIKKNIRHFIFSNNRLNFENQIDADLLKGKNICIVSMPSKLALYFENKYADKYKTILHCAKADDKYKDELKNVTELWKQYQLVIYSPSIESGVNFDCEHFHCIYVILSSKSTSPRALMQMMNRIRKLVSKNVMVYLNNMPFKEKSNFYVHDEVKEYVCEVFHKYLKPETMLDDKINKMVVRYKFDLYAQMLVYNETENANKNKNLFVPYLIKLLTEKGHTYEYDDTKFNKSACNKDVMTKNELLKASDVDQAEFNLLLSKQTNNQASREDKVKIERFMIKKDWKIDQITDDFLTKFYGKTYVLENLRCLLDKSKVNVYLPDGDDKHIIDFDGANKVEQINMISEVISKMGFDKIGDGKKLDKDNFQKNIYVVINECELFTNPNKSQPMFGYCKNKIGNIKTVKQFMGFINSLFCEWGIVVACTKKYTHIKVNDKRKTIVMYEYVLNYIDDINDYF